MDSLVLSSVDHAENRINDQLVDGSNAEESTTADSDAPETYLCWLCRSINFAQAFESESTAILTELERDSDIHHGIFIANVNWYWKSCTLCRLLGEIIEEQYESLDHTFTLRAFAPADMYNAYKNTSQKAHKYLTQVLWILPMPPSKSSIAWDVPKTLYDQTSRRWLGCYMLERSQPAIVRQREIPPYFDPEVARDWINACQREHPDTCNTSVESIPDLSLIDCDTLQISSFPTRPQNYVALSYVWAPPPNNLSLAANTYPSSCTDLPPWASLSLVVQDAIIATRKLGFQYLWIDKYCIAQHDPGKKLAQIEAMHLIYGAAQVTLVAGAGSDERHGLPGVQRARKSNRVADLGRVRLVHNPRNLSSTKYHSRWSSRGWTMQEEHFSRRKIYFFEEYTAFECRVATCTENFSGLEAAQSVEEVEDYNEIAQAETVMTKDSFPDAMTSMAALLFNYTSRDLTYAADALRAISGLQISFEEGAFPLYFLMGLPTIFSNDWLQGCVDAQLAATLSWEHIFPKLAVRRKNFPSWTWAGWTDRAFHIWLYSGRYNSIDWHPEGFIVENEDGRSVKLQSIWDCLVKDIKGDEQSVQVSGTAMAKPDALRFMKSTTALHFDAIVVDEQCFSDISAESSMPWLTARVFNLRISTGLFSTTESENTDAPFTPQFLINGIIDGYFGCILLGFISHDKHKTTRAHILVVEWHEVGGVKHARRIAKISGESEVDETVDVKAILSNAKRQRIRLS